LLAGLAASEAVWVSLPGCTFNSPGTGFSLCARAKGAAAKQTMITTIPAAAAQAREKDFDSKFIIRTSQHLDDSTLRQQQI
jgi:hypothetical protein